MADRSVTPGRVLPAVVALLLMLLSFAQRWGETTFDTKFDLTTDPGEFLARTLHLWNPQLSFGELQNQAYGYLFPQGPFFLLGEAAGLPVWVTQRVWSGLILVVAFEGARRLYLAADRGRPGAEWLALVAGLAFALSPRLLGLAGVLSAEVLPTAVLPWVVLPLVKGLRGEFSPRLAGLLSGAAVLFMGGVNAVEDLAALPLPALLLLSALGSAVGRRVALWWTLATTVACLWWFAPLLVLGRYSPPFLDYIETAAVTTDPLGWTNVLRGADHWVAFFTVSGQPWWPAAFDLARDPWLTAVTSVVAAISLGGLFHRRMPLRRPLVLSALLGLVLLTLAHESVLASPLSDPVRTLLDGVLAPLRNVHKVDPLVRLPFALGFAHAVGLASTAVSRRVRRRQHRARPVSRSVGAVAAGSAVLLLLASAQPMFTGQLRKPGWQEVPDAWIEAAAWLGDHAEGRRALVLPGSGFGQQTWGWTIDEPIQGVAQSPWVTRSQVPLVPGQTIRFLDSLQARINDGRGSPALADALARAGVGFVLVRRDLDPFASDAPSPSRVDQALRKSPGLSHAASFGVSAAGESLIEVLQVDRHVPRVGLAQESELVSVAGGPEDVLTLLESGQLPPDAPTVISTEEGWERSPDLVADGYRLRERQFGRLQDSLSQLLGSSSEFRLERKVHDYPGVPGTARVHAAYDDIRSVTASSSSGYADIYGPVRPELGPYSAVDGEQATYWRSAPMEEPRGQWLQVTFDEPQPLPYVDVTAGVDRFSGIPVREVTVQAGGQESSGLVHPGSGDVRLPLSGLPVKSIKITVTSVVGNKARGVVAIREVGLPGLAPARTLEVPATDADRDTGFVFRAEPHRRACVTSRTGRHCEPEAARPSEEENGIMRSFSTLTGGSWRVSGVVVARPGQAAADLLLPLDGVRLAASSVLAGDPSVSGQFAFDGDPLTAWLSQRGDLSPQIELRWDRPRKLSRLQVRGALMPSRAPSRAVLRAGDEIRTVELGSGSLGYFDPVRTDELTISFPMQDQADGEDPLPLGVGELVLDGLEGLERSPVPATRTGSLCGLGPTLTVDGKKVETRVRGTLADVVEGTEMTLEPCGDTGHLDLSAGNHMLSLPSTDRFAPLRLSLEPRASGFAEQVPERSVVIERWSSTERAVTVGPGDSAVLRIPENVNDGWRATLDGRPLEALRIDGWQQGYRVPAGVGGVITLTYTPDEAYRASLLGGAVAGLILLLAALFLAMWERRASRVGVTRPLAAMSDSYEVRIWALVPLLLATWLAGGVAMGAGIAVGFAMRGRRAAAQTPGNRRLLIIGSVAVALFGVAAAVVAARDIPLDSEVLDAFNGVAVGLMVSSMFVVTRRSVTRRRTRHG